MRFSFVNVELAGKSIMTIIVRYEFLSSSFHLNTKYKTSTNKQESSTHTLQVRCDVFKLRKVKNDGVKATCVSLGCGARYCVMHQESTRVLS